MMAVDYENRIKRVIAHIYDNPNGDLSLDALADVAALSRFHWHRVFRAMTGETCAHAVKRVRMHLASIALVTTDDPVAQIAAAVGYPQTASFSRAFSEVYCRSPQVFRSAGAIAPDPISLKGNLTMFDVEIRDVPARSVAALSHKGAYHEIGKTFQSLYAMIGSRGLFPEIREGVALYYCDPGQVPEKDLMSHAGVAMASGVPVPDGFESVAIATGPAAVLTLKGPYAGLPKAWDYLFGAWLAESGREPRDEPSYEVYLNDPTDTAPDDLVTEVVLPLKV